MTDPLHSIDDILTVFENYTGAYEREMVDDAIRRQTEITPRLIHILNQVIEDPQPFVDNEDRFDPVYALMLLGHFKAAEAHPVIVKLFHLPEKILDAIYSDIITTDLPTILANTCGGSIETMKSLVFDPDVDVFVRISALQAMAYAAVDDMALRDEVVTLYGTLFTGDEPADDPDFWGMMAPIVCELYPEEIMPVIEKAYDDNLISTAFIGLEEFRQTIQNGKAAAMETLRAQRDRFNLDDLHARMQGWACFQTEENLYKPTTAEDLFTSPLYTPPGFSPHGRSSDKIKQKRKKKRKQSKASKRKNRR